MGMTIEDGSGLEMTRRLLSGTDMWSGTATFVRRALCECSPVRSKKCSVFFYDVELACPGRTKTLARLLITINKQCHSFEEAFLAKCVASVK